VVEDLAPEVYKVYADANPASTSTNFYVTHNRPEAQLTVKITVYNLLGTPIWTSTTTSRSDMETSSPVKWNLTDMAGRRVQRGIYLYRAEISTDGETFSTGSQKIAVTAGN
jgi:flagellar hook assembly protein FlgD